MNFTTRLFLALVLPTSWLPGAWVWTEGEAVTKTNIGKHPWYYGQVKKSELSGGDFLAHFDDTKPGEAEYRVSLPEAGAFTLWVRANPVQTTLKVSVNGSAPSTISFGGELTDSVNIAANNAPDLRFLAWCKAGVFPMKSGENSVKFTMESANHHHGSIDCFLFTNEPFTPTGAVKPDGFLKLQKEIAAQNQGWLPWNPAEDKFTSSPIDLRFLNEKFAGEQGRIEVKGSDFVHAGSGRPIRFWGVNGPPGNQSGEALQGTFRMLAKHGVNLVRIHGQVFDSKTGELDPAKLKDRVAIVQAAKNQGIYTHLSIYFPLWMTPSSGPGWREGYNGEQHPFALLYFEPEFQKLYRSWWEALLTQVEPSGVRLVDDPALMSVELINEDSFFFWTFNAKNIPDPQLKKLEKLFGDWAIRKYGSIQKALEFWGGKPITRDDEAAGRLAFRPLFQMFTDKTERDQDTATFLLELQRKFYDENVKFIRSLGFRGLITASNWITANNDVFGPLEKFSYMGGDFIDRHGYFDTNLSGDNSAWSIRNGQTYSDLSALRFETGKPQNPVKISNPAMDPMLNSMPSMISETAWNRPNRYRGEAPLFFAIYGALQGSDAIVHFALDGSRWSPKPNFFMQPWTLMTPTQMGQFPAAALIYRQNLVKTGELAADLQLKISEMVALKGSPLSSKANLDQLREADVTPGQAASSDAGVDPLIHFVGPTNLRIDAEGGIGKIAPLSKYIDRNSKTVMSSTGELKLDFGPGVLRINAPCAQGVMGNLKSAGQVELDQIVVRSERDVAQIVAVSMDRLPLDRSQKILVQAMTEEKPTGFRTSEIAPNLFKINEIGGEPWLFREISGEIRFKRSDVADLKVTALDFNGYPVKSIKLESDGTLRLLPDTVYYVLEKSEPSP